MSLGISNISVVRLCFETKPTVTAVTREYFDSLNSNSSRIAASIVKTNITPQASGTRFVILDLPGEHGTSCWKVKGDGFGGLELVSSSEEVQGILDRELPVFRSKLGYFERWKSTRYWLYALDHRVLSDIVDTSIFGCLDCVLGCYVLNCQSTLDGCGPRYIL